MKNKKGCDQFRSLLNYLKTICYFHGSSGVTLNKPLFAWDEYDIFQLVMNKAPVFDIGILESRADLARILDVFRAKVTQMLNLLKLDEEIQEFMLGLEDTDKRLGVVTERRLRQISKIIDSVSWPGLWGKPYRGLLVQEVGLLPKLHGTADGGYRRPVDG